MRKHIITLILAMALSAGLVITVSAGWQESSQGWRYENEDGSQAANGWQQIDGGWYYFDEQGYRLEHGLTPDGYWLDESGLASEEMRVYGACMFAPTSYQTEGDKILITGNICDTQYSSDESLKALKPGDTILVPSNYGRVCEFDRPFAVADTKLVDTLDGYYDYKSGELKEGSRTMKCVYVNMPDSTGGEASEFIFAEDHMNFYYAGSPGQPLYRIVKKDVVLIADAGTNFIPVYSSGMESLSQTLEKWTTHGYNDYYVMRVELTGGHIDQAKDMVRNYS